MKVDVHYLFSRNKKIGSKLISWGTKHLQPEISDTPSHIAILINNRWVHESTLDSGVRVISYTKWLEINEEIDKIQCPIGPRDYSEIKTIFKEIKGNKYDYLGVTYLGISLGANKFLGTSIPETNKWESKDKYFCCEAVEKLTGLNSTSMKAPVQLMVELDSI